MSSAQLALSRRGSGFCTQRHIAQICLPCGRAHSCALLPSRVAWHQIGVRCRAQGPGLRQHTPAVPLRPRPTMSAVREVTSMQELEAAVGSCHDGQGLMWEQPCHVFESALPRLVDMPGSPLRWREPKAGAILKQCRCIHGWLCGGADDATPCDLSLPDFRSLAACVAARPGAAHARQSSPNSRRFVPGTLTCCVCVQWMTLARTSWLR